MTDFVVENCNEQGARMIGFSRVELIEVRFSQIYSGRIFEKVRATFKKAMEKGFHEDEFVQQGENGGRTWIHRRLVRSGDGIAITLRDISEAKAHESVLESLGNTDALTGLRNRYWLTQYLPGALEKARQAKSTLAVLYLDLDDFKDVNDTMGHDAGDHVLRQAGQRIASVLRPGDHVVRLGVRISVDDFGTGYSSLSQLQRLDLDVLKVDRAFTQALNDGWQGEAFFMTIVSMAHILGMHVVAEGVETLEQLTVLQGLGCNEVQGYFISRPVPAALATDFLGRRCLFPVAVPGLHAA